MGMQIDLAIKVKGQPRIIIWINLVGLNSPKLYTKFPPWGFLGSGEVDFFVFFFFFFPYMSMVDCLNKLIIPLTESLMWNLVKIGQAVSEKKMFKDYDILYMHTALGQGQITLWDKIFVVTKGCYYFDHTLEVSAIGL